MSVYRTAIETNYRLIKGETLSEDERSRIAAELLAEARPFEPSELTGRRELYPIFYIPPEGVGLRSLMGQTPKTKIFAGNMYELEILRLLCLLAPDDPKVLLMRDETLRRLRSACFGWGDDGVGECFDTSLVVLRFLCAAAPRKIEKVMKVGLYKR